MAGAGAEAGELATSSGGSTGEQPSAGGSGTAAGTGGSNASATSAGVGGAGATGNGGASVGGASVGDASAGGASAGSAGAGGVSAGGATSSGASGGTAGNASGGNSAGGSSASPFCGWGTYDTDLTDDELTCAAWSVCEPGSFEQVVGSVTRDRACEPCPEGTWSDQVWQFSCAPATLCAFGEQEEIELTPTHDRTCVTADLFGQRHFTDHVDAGALVVTGRGAYLSVRDTILGEALVLRYSLEGEYLGSWNPDEEQSILGDLTHIGDELFVASLKIVPDSEGGYTESGFVKKFSANGELIWEHELDGEPSEHVTAIGVASHDDTVVTVARVMDIECTHSNDETTCTSGASRLVLNVLDADGNQLLSETVEEESTVSDVVGVAVASDGKVHVAVTREILEFGPDCDQISEEDDPIYYYYDCVLGVPTWHDSLLLVDGTELIAEHSLSETQGRVMRGIAADAAGTAYALVRRDAPQYKLLRVDGSGELLLNDALNLEDEWLEAFAVTEAGLVLVGFSEAGPMLLRTNFSGQIQSREVLEDVANPWEISAIQEAEDGTMFLGGAASNAVFVVPWPE